MSKTLVIASLYAYINTFSRVQSDKYLNSPPDGATIYYRVLPSNRNHTVKSKTTWGLYMMNLLLQLRPLNVGSTLSQVSFFTEPRRTIRAIVGSVQSGVWRCLNACRLVTMSKTWTWCTPEAKEQSKHRTSPREAASKKAKILLSVGKVMVPVFCDSRWVFHRPPELNRFEAAEKTAPCRIVEEKSAFPPWQRIGSHLRCRHGQIGRISLPTSPPSTVFSRFGPVRFLCLSKFEKSLFGPKLGSNEEVMTNTEDLQKFYKKHGGPCRPPEKLFFS